jgi:two-component system, chemotaxis family, protein-glutamate methylesterase/glutaminase
MAARDVLVIGGSAGALPVLRAILPRFPADLAAAVLIVLHTARSRPGALAEVIGRYAPLPVRFPEDGDLLRHGEILVAPPDFHLLVDGPRVRVTRGPRENGFRPAIDPLFRTAARAYGERVVGVILSGALDDGIFGLAEIKRSGGLAVVQSPEEASFPSMPLAALQSVSVDAVLAAEKIAALLVDVAGTGRPGPIPGAALPLPAGDVAEEGGAGLRDRSLPGPPSAYTCPECGGALWEVADDRALGFRCHVGHSYASVSFLARHSEQVEGALWTALRTLEEAVALRRRMSRHAAGTGLDALAHAYDASASDAQQKADAIRDVLTDPHASLALRALGAGPAEAEPIDS